MLTPFQRPRKLKHQMGQNAADCLITAFCIAIDVPVFEAKRFLGHDGLSKMWPSQPSPTCYRGFTFAECIMFAYLRGYATIQHEFEGEYAPYYGVIPKAIKLPEAYRTYIIKNSIGILVLDQTQAFHAVAFSDGVMYDPANGTHILPEIQYKHCKTCFTIEPRHDKFIHPNDGLCHKAVGATK